MAENQETIAEGATEDASGFVDHIGVDLWRAFRSYEVAMFERVAQEGFDDVAVSDSDLLIYIPGNGIKLSDLSKKRGLTKQAVHERVQSLLNRGYVTVRDAPHDRRAKLVCLSERGVQLTAALRKIKLTLHQDIAAHLGEPRMIALRQMLAQLEQVIR